MVYIVDYYENRDKYDLYFYPQDPPPTDASLPANQRGKFYPTGYNPNFYLSPNNPSVDKTPQWNVVNLPFRRLNNKIFTYGGCAFDPNFRVGGGFAVNGFEGNASPDNGNNINSWNTGWPSCVVVSDRHIATCAHFLGGGAENEYWGGSVNVYRFLDNNGNVVEKNFTTVPGDFEWFSSRAAADIMIMKLRDDEVGFEESGIPIVTEIGNLHSLPTSKQYPLYIRGPQGKVHNRIWHNIPEPVGKFYDLYYDKVVDRNSGQFIYTDTKYKHIFEGDSGSPCWIRFPDGNFLFCGFQWGTSIGGDLPITNAPDGILYDNAVDWINAFTSNEGSPSNLSYIDLSSAGKYGEASTDYLTPNTSSTYQTSEVDGLSRVRTEVLISNQNPVYSECEELGLEGTFSDNYLNGVFVTLTGETTETVTWTTARCGGENSPLITVSAFRFEPLNQNPAPEFITPNINIDLDYKKFSIEEVKAVPPHIFTMEFFLDDVLYKSLDILLNEPTTGNLPKYIQSIDNADWVNRTNFTGIDGKCLTWNLKFPTTEAQEQIEPNIIKADALGKKISIRWTIKSAYGIESSDIIDICKVKNLIAPENPRFEYDPDELVPGKQNFTATLVTDNTPDPELLFLTSQTPFGIIGNQAVFGRVTESTLSFDIPENAQPGETILFPQVMFDDVWGQTFNWDALGLDPILSIAFSDVVRGVPCVCDIPSGNLTMVYCRTAQNNAGDCLYEDTLMKIFLENLQPTSPPDCVPEVIIWDDPLNDLGKPIKITPVDGGNPGFVDFEEEFSLDPGSYIAEVVIENCNGPVTLQVPISITDSSFGCLGGGGGGGSVEDCSLFSVGGGGGGGGGGSQSGTWGFYDVPIGFNFEFQIQTGVGGTPLVPGGNNDLLTVIGIQSISFLQGNAFFPTQLRIGGPTDLLERLTAFSISIDGVNIPIRVNTIVPFTGGGWVTEDPNAIATIDALLNSNTNQIIGGTYTCIPR